MLLLLTGLGCVPHAAPLPILTQYRSRDGGDDLWQLVVDRQLAVQLTSEGSVSDCEVRSAGPGWSCAVSVGPGLILSRHANDDGAAEFWLQILPGSARQEQPADLAWTVSHNGEVEGRVPVR